MESGYSVGIEWESLDRKFVVIQARETIEPEEIPKLVESIGRIIINASFIFTSAMKRDPVGVAAGAVNIYDELKRIKKILE